MQILNHSHMKKIVSTLLVVFIINYSFAQKQLVKTPLPEYKIEISIPQVLNRQYTQDNLKVIGNAAGNVKIMYDQEPETVTDNDIPAYTDSTLKILKAVNKSFKYIDDGIHLQDGKNIGYIKYSYKENGKKYFEYLFYISVDDKPVGFAFSCPLKERKQWDATIDIVANSIRVTR